MRGLGASPLRNPRTSSLSSSSSLLLSSTSSAALLLPSSIIPNRFKAMRSPRRPLRLPASLPPPLQYDNASSGALLVPSSSSPVDISSEDVPPPPRRPCELSSRFESVVEWGGSSSTPVIALGRGSTPWLLLLDEGAALQGATTISPGRSSNASRMKPLRHQPAASTSTTKTSSRCTSPR